MNEEIIAKELRRELLKRKWRKVKTYLKSLVRPPLRMGEEGYLTLRGFKVKIVRVR